MAINRLHELVQSLTQAEKRYFKLFLNRYSRNNDSSNFAQLFDYLVKDKSGDSADLLKNCSFIRPNQLQNVRNRLYAYILLALRNYKASTSKSSRIDLYQIMINYEILIQKGLFLQAWRMLVKAEKIAESNEYYHSLAEILEFKSRLLNSRLKSRKFKIEHENNLRKIEVIQAAQKYINNLKAINRDFYELFKLEGRIVRDSASINKLHDDLKKLEPHLVLFSNFKQAKHLFEYNMSTVKFRLGNWSEAIEHLKPLLHFYDDQTIDSDNFNNFRRVANSIAIASNMSGRYMDSLSIFKRIRRISKIFLNNKEIQLAIFEDTFYFELEIYILSFQFELGINHIRENRALIDFHDDKMHNVNQQSKRYRIALCFFGAKMYDEALEWINRIIINDELKYRKDVLASTRILELLCHYELDNYRFVKNKIKSTSAYLKKIDRWRTPESLLLNALKKLCDKEQKTPIFTHLIIRLEKQFKIEPLDRFFFCYFDLPKWLRSRLS